MTQDELLAEARTLLVDTIIPYYYTDASLIRWLNEGMSEACRRSRIITGNATPISVTSASASYTTPSNLFQILRAKLSNVEQTLEIQSYKVMDYEIPSWESETGTPYAIITDFGSNTVILYPKPIASDTLTIFGTKDPTSLSDIPTRYHYGLVNWILHKAYQVPVMDNDPMYKGQVLSPAQRQAKSQEHYFLFEQEYGKRSSAQDEIFNLRQRPFDSFDGYY